MSFRFGALQRLGNQVSVPIKADEDGYLGRECPNPECEEYFKITPGTGIKGPAPCHCPYCGHVGEMNTFWSKEQIEYARSVVKRKVVEAVRKDLKSLEFEHKPSGPFGISFSMKLQPGAPVPLAWYREKNLETQIVCDRCTLRYAIYGVFGWCPDCGVHNSLQILLKNLDLSKKKLTLASTLDGELVESVTGDALSGIVSALDGFGRELFSTEATRISFQSLEGARRRLRDLRGFDFADGLSEDEWRAAVRCFQKRHLFAHKMGVIDEEYIEKSFDADAVIGRKISVSVQEVLDLVSIVERIGTSLFTVIQPPTCLSAEEALNGE